jgi:hypothetical protein
MNHEERREEGQRCKNCAEAEGRNSIIKMEEEKEKKVNVK